MDWRSLLQPRRIGRSAETTGQRDLDELRTEFFRDWDRIVFCSAFRRLQDKTQVHPMAKTDYVRTRLTHSLEVASVGRSLGMQAGRVVSALDPGLRHLASPQDMGAIVAAACLMHDIGNPPFGHAGESAIQEYFRSPGRAWLQDLPPAEQADLLHFEGNAQGFRTAVRLQHPEQPGGLQLTWPTLGAFAKYPCDAVSGLQPGAAVSCRKFGFMQGERPLFAEVAEGLGLQRTGASAWQRHPLAFLVEAADDICYGVIDIEDGAKSGHITPEELRALHTPFIDAVHRARADTLQDRQHQAEYLRAVTIGVLVDRVARVFRERHDDILAGRFDQPLLDHIEGAQDFRCFKDLASQRLYDERSKLELQVAAFEIIGWLLQALCDAVESVAAGTSASERARMLVGLIPAGAQAAARLGRYQRLLTVTDFVAGMTDTYAVETYRRLRGFSA
jgi:dGTPase